MTDYYKTEKETLREAQEKVRRYDNSKRQIKQEIKRHRTLEQTTEDESYKLAHSMTADFLEEVLGGYE